MWIALSKDLLETYSFGDSVLVTGIADSIDGVYIVKDKVNSRIKNTVDILVNKDEIKGKWNVKIRKLN